MYNARVHHEQKVSNNLYYIDVIMKNCFMERAKKQEPCPIYKHVIFDCNNDRYKNYISFFP